MKQLPDPLQKKLDERKAANALRTLSVEGKAADFSSNDYLGFSRSEELFRDTKEFLEEKGTEANGATGSRLLTGNHSLYPETENYIAHFHNAESALLFNSGYDANTGFFASVPQKGDIVLYDEYIHASIRDGLRLGNAAAYKFRHNDLEHLEKLVRQHKVPGREIYIITETVFSMDGDSPDMLSLIALVKQYGCNLVLDEAHALGVFGTKGEGLGQEFSRAIFARIVTFGKGLGCHGAAVLGSAGLKAYLVNFARSLIYTTGLPPHSVGTIYTAYRKLEKEGDAGKRLREAIGFFEEETIRCRLSEQFIASNSAIHCAIVPGNENVKRVAAILQQNGYDVRPILSPTVPAGQERLRFCLHSYNTKDEITGVLQLFSTLILPT